MYPFCCVYFYEYEAGNLISTRIEMTTMCEGSNPMKSLFGLCLKLNKELSVTKCEHESVDYLKTTPRNYLDLYNEIECVYYEFIGCFLQRNGLLLYTKSIAWTVAQNYSSSNIHL